MSIMGQIQFVIRDGTANDVEACLALDHSYETEHVWQINLRDDINGKHINFKRERLPRSVTRHHPQSNDTMMQLIQQKDCFLVVTGKQDGVMFGYLTMRRDQVKRIAIMQDVVVDQAYRENGIANRLLGIATQWAKEHDCDSVQIEIQPQNVPAIDYFRSRGFTFSGYNDSHHSSADVVVYFTRHI